MKKMADVAISQDHLHCLSRCHHDGSLNSTLLPCGVPHRTVMHVITRTRKLPVVMWRKDKPHHVSGTPLSAARHHTDDVRVRMCRLSPLLR